MQIETRKIAELHPYPKNPRSITEDKAAELKRKISRWGQIGALLIDGRDNSTILGGNHVYDALRELGIETAKVEYRTPKDDAEAFELVILHNERFAAWVQNDLGALLKQYQGEIDLSGYHIDMGKGTGLKDILARYGKTEEDEFDGTLPISPASETGKVYQLGEHRLMCGDSTKPEDVAKLMGGGKASVIVTDPPYGVSYKGNPNGQDWEMIANDDLRGDKLDLFLTAAFLNAAKNSISNVPAYVFYAHSTHIEFQKALEATGFKLKQQLIWVKHMVIGHSDYHWTHEPIMYCSQGKERPPFFGDRTNRTVMETAGEVEKMSKEKLVEIVKALRDSVTTTIQVRKDTMHYQHPTQKPIAIMTPLIKNSSAMGEIVLDLFTGSGSTLIACEQLGRKSCCMEFSPAFCDVIRKRYAKFINKEDRWEELTPEL